MGIQVFNIVFVKSEGQERKHYFWIDGEVLSSSSGFHEAELPTRLQGLRFLGVQSVYVYLMKSRPKPLSEWQRLDSTQKQLAATCVAKLAPGDSVESWVGRVHQEMEETHSEFAELSITANKPDAIE